MVIDQNPNAITGQAAKNNAEKEKASNAIGKQTTDRGTLIVPRDYNGGYDKTAFFKIMIAEMKNMDPSSSQDNTQYVTQMAQLTTMEQMNNLNETMTTYSYQALVGKGVTVNVTDNNGIPYTGIVKGVSKVNNGWRLSVEVNENGKNTYKVFDASTLTSVLGTSDNTNANMLVNSDFMAASNLASNKDNKVVILNTDSKGTSSIVKGTVKSAFLDAGVVKIRVATFDDKGNESTTTTDYPYSYVVKAGNLTDADMDVKVSDYIPSNTSSEDINDPNNPKNPNNPNYDKNAAYDRTNNSKTTPTGSSTNNSTTSSDDMAEQQKKLQAVQNG